MPSFAELLVKIGGDATGFNAAMSSVVNTTDATVKQTETKLGSIAKLFEGMGGKIAAGIGFAGLATSIVAAATKFEEAGFTIRRATGATGDELATLEASFNRLYSSSARSAEEVSGALSSIKVETKLSGEALEALTQQNLRFAKVTGTDVKQAIESTQGVFKAWNVAAQDQADVLDILYRVIQETKISTASLTSQLASAAPIARTLGLSFQETAALIGNMEEKGVNAEKTFAALAQGFKKLAADSADPRGALFDLIEKMKGARDQTEAAAMAAPIFGRNAVVLADAVRKGAMDVQEFSNQLGKNKDSVRAAAQETESWRSVLVKAQHQLETTVTAHKDLILTASLAVPALATLGKGMWSVISAVGTKLPASGGIFAVGGASLAAAIYATSKAIDDLEARYDSFERRMKQTSDEPLPWEKWTKFQGEGVTADLPIKFIAEPLKEATAAAERAEEAMKRLKEEQKRLREELERAELAYQAVARAYNKGEASARQLADAHVRLKLAQDAANPEKLIEWHQKQNDEYLKWAAKMGEVRKKADEMRAAYQEFVDSVDRGDVDRRLMEISATSETLSRNLSKIKIPETLTREADAANDATRELAEAFKKVGIEHDRSADAMADAYEKIKNSGIATAREILVAERAALKAKVEEAQAIGEKITEADKQRLAELDKALGVHIQRQKSAWEELGRELVSLGRSFNRNISEVLIEGLAGGKNVWENIEKAFSDMLKRMGASIVNFGIEFLEKRLFKWFDSQFGSILDNIDSSFGKIFDPRRYQSVAANIPGVGGAGAGVGAGAGGAGGAVLSGVMGSASAWVGAAASAVGAAITAIGQARMEGTLNAIEKEARYAQIHLYYILERVNEFLPKLADIHGYLLNQFQVYVESINKEIVDRISPGVEGIVSRLDQLLSGGGIVASVVLPQESAGETASETRETEAVEQAPAGNVEIPQTAETIPTTVGGEYRFGGRQERPAATKEAAGPSPLRQLVASLQNLMSGKLTPAYLDYALGTQKAALERAISADSTSEQDLIAAIAKLDAEGRDVSDPERMRLDALLAFKRNTGPDYQAWLNAQIARTQALVATATEAIAARRTATEPTRRSEILQATVNVFIDGRQVGNAMVENLALVGVSM